MYHPAWDPDDQVDLGVAYALPELDVRAIICDHHSDYTKDLHINEPGFVQIVQLNWLTGKSVPFATGPCTKLRGVDDDGSHYPLRDQAGIELLLRELSRCEQKAYISIVGSSRTVAAAFNRNPDLFREKVKAILLGAGSPYRDKESKLDTNCRFDPAAVVCLVRSGLPIQWYPPNAGMIPGSMEPGSPGLKHCTKFQVQHEVLFKNLPEQIQAWMMNGFTGNLRGDIIRSLFDTPRGGCWWGVVLPSIRTLSHGIMFTQAAGRKLRNTPEGWRFLPTSQCQDDQEEFGFTLEPVSVTIDDDAHTTWQKCEESNIHLVYLQGSYELYAKAMGQAINGMLCDIPIEPEGERKHS